MMSNQDIIKYILDNSHVLKHNAKLLDIYEGNLIKYVEEDLHESLSEASFDQMRERICPISIIRKLVDKLSTIYQQSPSRIIEDGTDTDTELLEWYIKTLKFDSRMNIANEYFNLFKSTLVQPVIDPYKRLPFIRIIPSDRFLPISENEVNTLDVTKVVTLEGKKRVSGRDVEVFYVYSPYTFEAIDSNGDPVPEIMAQYGLDGTNPYGVLPFVYVNRSMARLVPTPDSDVLRLTKLIPVLISDLAFAIKFSCFSINYAINCSPENLTMAPNAFWTLQGSDPEKKPEIGSIKPQVDIQEVMNFIETTLSLWLQTRGIKPGAIGSAQGQDFSSGISKIIDEMDTVEDREKQVQFFTAAEESFWNILMIMHNEWVDRRLIDQTAKFSPNAKVVTKFVPQLPLISRGQLVADLKSEVEAGFTTRLEAIKRLNPSMSEQAAEELLDEIEGEDETQEETSNAPKVNNNMMDEMPEDYVPGSEQ